MIKTNQQKTIKINNNNKIRFRRGLPGRSPQQCGRPSLPPGLGWSWRLVTCAWSVAISDIIIGEFFFTVCR